MPGWLQDPASPPYPPPARVSGCRLRCDGGRSRARIVIVDQWLQLGRLAKFDGAQPLSQLQQVPRVDPVRGGCGCVQRPPPRPDRLVMASGAPQCVPEKAREVVTGGNPLGG